MLRQELPLTEEQEQLMDIVLRESERLNDTIRSFSNTRGPYGLRCALRREQRTERHRAAAAKQSRRARAAT